MSDALMMFALCLTYMFLAGLGVNLGYHRLLSHRSFRCSNWLKYTLILLGIPAGTPIQWAGNHRYHHATSDSPDDPHSPHFGGFWYSHVGWYLSTCNVFLCVLYSLGGPLRMIFDAFYRPRTNQQWNHLAKDVSDDPFLRRISQPFMYAVLCIGHAVIPLCFGYLLASVNGVVALWIMMVILFNIGDSIDSVAHIWGEKKSMADGMARNNWALGILALGEGWHDNHHTFPSSPCHGLLKRQWDWGWCILRTLYCVGLVSELRLPTIDQMRKKLSCDRSEIKDSILRRVTYES